MLQNKRAETVLKHRPGPNHNPTFSGGAAMSDPKSNIPEKSTQEIPFGFCRCGCGEKTNLATRNDKHDGRIKGEPMQFIRGHYIREPHGNNYKLTRSPSHHRAKKGGCVLVHILIAEKVLGKPLPLGAVVHHADGRRLNNEKYNLVICQDNSYHKLLHLRMRALKESGHANYRKCNICKQWDKPEKLSISKSGCRHLSCRRELYAAKKI
jgi:hypothetical protein